MILCQSPRTCPSEACSQLFWYEKCIVLGSDDQRRGRFLQKRELPPIQCFWSWKLCFKQLEDPPQTCVCCETLPCLRLVQAFSERWNKAQNTLGLFLTNTYAYIRALSAIESCLVGSFGWLFGGWFGLNHTCFRCVLILEQEMPNS